MATEWYVRQGGVVYGPYSAAKIRALARDGRIIPDTEVSTAAGGPWNLAAQIRGLTFPVDPPIEAGPARPPSPAEPPVVPVSPGGSAVERDLWSGRPSQLVNLRMFVLCGLFCWLVVPVFRAIWCYLVVRTTRYELTSQRFRVIRGILTRESQELELYRVKDTAFSQSIVERLFGLATVRIVSSDHTTPTTVIESVPAATAGWIRETIRTLVEDLRVRKFVREVDYSAEP